MDPCLLVSPHLDDAVLSAGQFMASWSGCYVYTAFAGIPPKEYTTTFDVNCGFADSSAAINERWHEDDRALRVLEAKPLHGNHIDNQYRIGDMDFDQLVEDVSTMYVATHSTKLIGPLGLMHPDHEAAAIACIVVAKKFACEFWVYEDLPSRVLWPESVPPALERMRTHGFNPTLGHLGVGDINLKRKAVSCYASQSWALDSNVLFVPERFWRAS